MTFEEWFEVAKNQNENGVYNGKGWCKLAWDAAESEILKKLATVICNNIGIGVSAKSIFQMYPPADAYDFKRCHNLLSVFPEWKEEIKDIGKTYEAWGTIGEHWIEIERAYLKEDWKSVNQMLEKYSFKAAE